MSGLPSLAYRLGPIALMHSPIHEELEIAMDALVTAIELAEMFAHLPAVKPLVAS